MAEDIDERRAVIRTSLMTPSPLERYRPERTRRDSDDDMVLLTGRDSHHVLVLGSPGPDRVFALAQEFFGQAGGYSIELEADANAALERELLHRGWRKSDEKPALVMLDTPTTFPHGHPDLDIRRVTEEACLADFRSLSGTTKRWVPSLEAATDPAVALFVGYRNNSPVASSRLVCLENVAEITGVTTAPEYRRRGYGTAMTWAAVAEGVRHGCTAAVLTATSMGYPLYVRMGFRPVLTFRTYTPLEARDQRDIAGG